MIKNNDNFTIYDNVNQFALYELKLIKQNTNCYEKMCQCEFDDELNDDVFIYILNVNLITNILNLIENKYKNKNIKIARYDDFFEIVEINNDECISYLYYIDENGDIDTLYDEKWQYDNYDDYVKSFLNN